MTESATTTEIRRWHTELRQGNEDWYDLAGELLDRLDKAEQRLGNVGELPEKWLEESRIVTAPMRRTLKHCADELESILNQSSSETSR